MLFFAFFAFSARHPPPVSLQILSSSTPVIKMAPAANAPVSSSAALAPSGASLPRNRPTDDASAAKLRAIYEEMRSRQLKAIQKAGTMRSDPFFVPDAKLAASTLVGADTLSGSDISVDDRRCLAISSVINDTVDCRWTDAFHQLQRRLKEEFSAYGLTFSQHPPKVGGGQLHWTLMQLVGFLDYDAEVLMQKQSDADVDNGAAINSATSTAPSVYLSPEYLDCVQDSLMVGGLDTGIHIRYVGVVLVATGLLMVGVPSLDINEARDVVRSRLSENKLPLKEPFVNDIVHSTLYRVAGDTSDMPKDLHVRLMNLAKEYQNVDLGTVVLNKFQVGPASWRVLADEMEATPPARQWELPVHTPSESYNENVLSERGFTVSGASGAKLAKELRQVLSKQTSEVDDIKDQAAVMDSGLPLRPLTPPRGDDDKQKTSPGKKSSPTAAAIGLDEMKNSHNEVRERIDTLNVRDSIPQACPTKMEEDALAGMQDNAATLSGAAGLALAQELQKKLQEEQRALDRMYYTDFY